MKERKESVKGGAVLVYRGPRFCDYRTMYQALNAAGKPVGMAQVSRAAALALLS
jgi:hypothetical protein